MNIYKCTYCSDYKIFIFGLLVQIPRIILDVYIRMIDMLIFYMLIYL